MNSTDAGLVSAVIVGLFMLLLLSIVHTAATYIMFSEYKPDKCYIECIGDDNNPFEEGTFCNTYKILDRKGDYIKIKEVNSNEVSTRQLYPFSFVYKSRLIMSCGGK